ncbi:hypothetical protein EVAR_24759_1 [Eumeta japonica]|uniref:Uncharacterized protein n=1 Tax=Eumeta variegata TaxID=151549 RepID=A0A4C1VD76_EUMVA|nr:hypothetical protein EVAR_24759_1 [Eumeta japonica]
MSSHVSGGRVSLLKNDLLWRNPDKIIYFQNNIQAEGAREAKPGTAGRALVRTRTRTQHAHRRIIRLLGRIETEPLSLISLRAIKVFVYVVYATSMEIPLNVGSVEGARRVQYSPELRPRCRGSKSFVTVASARAC